MAILMSEWATVLDLPYSLLSKWIRRDRSLVNDGNTTAETVSGAYP
jgi:hypothetical protein